MELQIRISTNWYTHMKIQFKQQLFPKFWICVDCDYTLLSQKAVKMLLRLATT